MDRELLTVDIHDTVLTAVDKIQLNHHRAVVVLAADRVAGICSQGDVMRLFLRGGSEHTVLEDVIQHPFVYLSHRDLSQASQLMRQRGITLIPVVDEQFHLQDIVTLNDVFDYLDRRQ